MKDEDDSLAYVGGAAALICLAGAISFVEWTKRAYGDIEKKVKSNNLDPDSYVRARPSLAERIQCIFLRKYMKASREISYKPYELVTDKADHVPGLKVTRRAGDKEKSNINFGSNKAAALVIGTIRMGFGHHRIAYSTASWGLGSDVDVIFHDIVNVDSGESSFIADADKLYSYGSRTVTEAPNPLERLMGSATKGGSANMLRLQCQAASLIRQVLTGLDKRSPIISTHPLVGCTAVAAGFENVINLVVDNHAQWFVVVPGALNLVQGPLVYQELLKMGVPDNELELVGHWCPKEMVIQIPETVRRRISRLSDKKPLRLLIPVGGAGAQKTHLCRLIDACSDLVKQGKLQLFLNAGDHKHIKEAFEEQLDKSKLDFERVKTTSQMKRFADRLFSSESNEPTKAVTLFAFDDDYYPAVAATDTLCNVSDVLVCKPSEMAFYCIPKLMIRRVGDHEQKSAKRAVELGDGTLEARTINEMMENIHQFLDHPSVLINMNKAVEKNAKIGIYDGCKIAVEKALERSTRK